MATRNEPYKRLIGKLREELERISRQVDEAWWFSYLKLGKCREDLEKVVSKVEAAENTLAFTSLADRREIWYQCSDDLEAINNQAMLIQGKIRSKDYVNAFLDPLEKVETGFSLLDKLVHGAKKVYHLVIEGKKLLTDGKKRK